MLSFKKSKKIINIFIEDYILRFVETVGSDLSTSNLFKEVVLPSGLITNGRLTDELAFYQLMKETVKELGIKNRHVRFNVPNSIVIMRQVDVPLNLQDKNAVYEYIETEIGKSIHLPFEDPILDFTFNEDREQRIVENGLQKITFFAAPGEELRKYTEVFVDASFKPLSADVGILGDYRYFQHINGYQEDKIYLIVEFNVTSIHLGIFHQHQLEFLRYQDIDVKINTRQIDHEKAVLTWDYQEEEGYIKGLMQDQVNELEKIMNFYQFSLYKGEKQVTDIILLGDYKFLNEVYTDMKNSFGNINIISLADDLSKKLGDKVPPAFIPALGLAFKGGTHHHASRS